MCLFERTRLRPYRFIERIENCFSDRYSFQLSDESHPGSDL